MAFKHPGKIAAPFNIMSSSATGGYLKHLHSNFVGSVEISNFHEDICQGTHDTVPLQGPFTSQWVGGRQHRHQDIVTGSINGIQRAESLKVIPDSNRLLVYGADYPSLHQARAVLYRDGTAKRPLNIANIQYGTGSQRIGNYQHSYQVVQTTGRSTNPRDFAENSTAYQAFPERMTHEGDVLNSTLNDTGSLRSYTLPTRSKTKAILVNKFSAPGDRYTMSRGFLDPAGEEMSAYNAMPFRNLPNRTTLRNRLSRHMKFGGFESGSATEASLHKVYRNSNKTPNKTSFDNYFIQRPIPQTDLQYAWITESISSLDSTSSAFYGYQSDAEALSLYTSSPRFLESRVRSNQNLGQLTDTFSIVIPKETLAATSDAHSQRASMDVFYSRRTKKYFLGISQHPTSSPSTGTDDHRIEFYESDNGDTWQLATTVSGAHDSFKPMMQFVESHADLYALYHSGLGQASRQHYSGSFIFATKWHKGNLVSTTSPMPNKRYTWMQVQYDYFREQWISVHRDFYDPPGTIVFSSGSNFNEWTQAAAGLNGQHFSSSWAAFLRAPPYIPKPATGNSLAYPYDGLQVVIDSNYYYHVYGIGTGSISYMRSTDGGKTFGDPHYIYISDAQPPSGSGHPGLYLGRAKAIEFKGKQHIFFNESHADSNATNSGRHCILTSSANNTWLTASSQSKPSHRIPDYTTSGIFLPNALGMEKDIDTFLDRDGRLYHALAAKQDTSTGWVGYNFTDELGKYKSESAFRGSHSNIAEYGINNSSYYSPTFVENRDASPGETSLALYWYASGSVFKNPIKTREITPRQEPTITNNTYHIMSSSIGDTKLEKRFNFSTWRQIRKEDPLTKHFQKNNIVPITNVSMKQKTDGSRKEKIINHQLVDPPITSKYKPLVHTLSLDEGATAGAYDLQSAYGTYVEFYNNDRVNDLLQITPDDEDTFYGKFLKSYLLGDKSLLSNAALKFINEILHFSYEEQIYPKKDKMYLKEARTRDSFEEAAGQQAGGYDRTYGTQTTFYRDTAQRSSTNSLNSMGYDPSSIIGQDQTFDFSFTSAEVPPNTTKNAGSDVFQDTSTSEFVMQFNGSGERFFEILTPFAGAIELTFSYLIGRDTTVGGRYYENPENHEHLLVEFKHITASTWTPTGTAIQYAFSDAGYWEDPVTYNIGGGIDGSYNIRIHQKSHSGNGYDHFGVKNVKVTGRASAKEKPASAFWPMRTDGPRSFQEENNYSENVGELMQDTDESIYGASPVPSLSYLESTHIRKNFISSDYVERLTETISGKKPFADTYNDFREEYRGIAKDMSLLPEYTISDHIDKFVGSKSDPVSLTDGYLKVHGAAMSSSAGNKSGISENDFFNTYLTTDDMRYFSRGTDLTEEHAESGLNYSTLDIDVTAVKKMMLRNGFYPITRTVQLGNILSSSFSGRIRGFENDVLVTGSEPAKRTMQGLLKPYLSPGILYNSLKSGIAVDYPIYTASAPTVIEGGDNTFGEFNLAAKPDFRLPFESLYIPNKLPANDKIRFISSFVSDEEVALSFPYQFSWDGMFNNPNFELGMHNFLAETVDFFLQEGELTTFKSRPQSEFSDDLDPSRKYYMDVSLSDVEQLNKFVEYSGVKRVTPKSHFSADVMFADAVSGSDAYYACGISHRNSRAYASNLQPQSLGSEIVTVWKNYLDDTGWQKVQDIELDNLSPNPFRSSIGETSADPYGTIGSGSGLSSPSPVKMCYGTSGFHIAIGDPYFHIENDSNRLGAVHLIKAGENNTFERDLENGGYKGHLVITSSHFSDGGQGSRNYLNGQHGGLCGSGLAITDDNKKGLYIATSHWYHPSFTRADGSSVSAQKGAVFLFHSKSSGFNITQGQDHTEYHMLLTSSFVNQGRPGQSSALHGTHLNLIDAEYVDFKDDPNTQASGLHMIVGSPHVTVGENIRAGKVTTFHIRPKKDGKKIELKKQDEFSGSLSSTYSHFGGSVAVGVDKTGTKKEVYYFASDAATGTSISSGYITSSVMQEDAHGRVYAFVSQSVPVPPGYTRFNPDVHFTTISASWATYISGSEDIKSFAPRELTLAGFAHHIDAEVSFNKETGKNEVYVAATIPQMSASNMDNTFLSGGLAIISLSSSVVGTNWFQSQSINAADYDSNISNAYLNPKTRVKMIYGSNPNNASDKLFTFCHVGGGSTAAHSMDAPSWPSASVGAAGVAASRVESAIIMFTGSMTMPTLLGQNALHMSASTISASSTHQGQYVNKQHGKLYGLGVDAVMDPGYVAYTPPHFYGEAIARISYKPSTSVKPTIREIFQSAEIEDILLIDNDRVATHSGRQRKYENLTPTQKQSKMPVGSAIDLFGTAVDPEDVSFDQNGKKSFRVRRASQDNTRWVISTKYECPVLDSRPFDTQYSSSYTSHNDSVDATFGFISDKEIKKPKTPWSTFGEYNEDVLPSLAIRDSFAQSAYGTLTGSLLDVVGFEPETKRVSKIAESKTVSEAILLVPYFERRNFTTGQPFLDKDSFSPVKLSKDQMIRSLRYGPSTDGIYRIPEMIEDMQKYHIPPRLDFLKYGRQIRDKFAMFFIEVDHTFSREDLANIWQGLTPELATTMAGELFNQKLKVSIKDFFQSYGGKPPTGLKFAVFKVKQKAKKNYFKTTSDSKDDKNFLVSFAGDAKVRIDEDRSFNWPYDYFSLIEAAKIETTINMSAGVFTDERTITIADEDRSKAISALLGLTAFNRRKRKRRRTSRERLPVSITSLPKNLRKPEENAEKEAAARKIVEAVAKDEPPQKKNRYRFAKIPRIAKPNAKMTSQKRKPNKAKSTKALTKSSIKLEKSFGLGKKTLAVVRDNSQHRRKLTKRQAKNLKQMVSIIGTRFSWKTKRGRG